MLIDRGALHIGDHAGAAAEGQHRQAGEQADQLQQDRFIAVASAKPRPG